MAIHGFAALKAKSPLEPFSYEPKPLGPSDVEVKITHCGICHSDIHLIDNDWQMSSYPFVPGHEVVGIISEAGQYAVVKKGQRVGIGWQSASCMECEWCIKGEENFCIRQEATCVGRNGGYADKIRVDSRFAFPIPQSLSSEEAAPLLCGGITVYSPLRRYVTPPMKVGVIGIGGLGHLAIQFANAMGCEVTAFSTSPEKKEEARKLGAKHFVLTSDSEQMKKVTNSLDFILFASTTGVDWAMYLGILRPYGTLCVVGASPEPVIVSASALLSGNKQVVGSNTGGRAAIIEMLDFAARHNVKAQVEVTPMAQANAAIAKVRKNNARYRIVLKN
jgi:alcohol/geraniol dehydrogenase (NADP+)